MVGRKAGPDAQGKKGRQDQAIILQNMQEFTEDHTSRQLSHFSGPKKLQLTKVEGHSKKDLCQTKVLQSEKGTGLVHMILDRQRPT